MSGSHAASALLCARSVLGVAVDYLAAKRPLQALRSVLWGYKKTRMTRALILAGVEWLLANHRRVLTVKLIGFLASATDSARIRGGTRITVGMAGRLFRQLL